MNIKLNRTEFFHAATVGIIRNIQNLTKGHKQLYGAKEEDGWKMNIQGACGESAVAKMLNIYYSGNIGNLKACDVNNKDRNIEVRTATKDHYRLILHPKDPDESIFVLVTGLAPKFSIKGWLFAKEAKQEKYWQDTGNGRPAYFVPQNDLKDIQSLKDFLQTL